MTVTVLVGNIDLHCWNGRKRHRHSCQQYVFGIFRSEVLCHRTELFRFPTDADASSQSKRLGLPVLNLRKCRKYGFFAGIILGFFLSFFETQRFIVHERFQIFAISETFPILCFFIISATLHTFILKTALREPCQPDFKTYLYSRCRASCHLLC